MSVLKRHSYLLIVFSAIFSQVALRYFGKDYVLAGSIRYMNFGVQFLVPLLIWKVLLKEPFFELGWELPRISKRGLIWILSFLIVLPVVMLIILQSPSYLEYYGYYRSPKIDFLTKINYFSKFTWSTITGWEFLHRGFLLFGLQKVLRPHIKEAPLLEAILISQVLAFETLYHLIKPAFESFGMILFSPLLSWIALRTKSFWIPMGIHLYLEYVFISYVILM